MLSTRYSSWHFLMGTLIVLGIMGCTPRPAPHQPTRLSPADIRSFCNVATCMNAEFIARIQPRNGPAETLEITVRFREDGRMRIDMSRLDVVGIQLLVEANGAITALLPRENAVAHLAVAEPRNELIPLSYMRLLAQELAYGPLPAGNTNDEHGTMVLLDPATQLHSRISLDETSGLPRTKQFTSIDGNMLLSIDYDRWKLFGTIQRPSRCTITTHDGLRCDIRLIHARPVAAIASGGLALEVPIDARTVEIKDIKNLLGIEKNVNEP